MEVNEYRQIEERIIRVLAEENCTIRDAKYILSQVDRYIVAYGTVQFSGMPDYEL